MNKSIVTIYTRESSFRKPALMVYEMVRDLLASRELAWQLALRDIKAQYRQTVLGLLWAFITPVANASAWLFIQSAGIISMRDTEIPYPVYVFCGTILWTIFMEAVRTPLERTNAAKPMLAKINFPREALIISGIYQTLFNGGIKITILLTAIIILGIRPDWQILFFPISLLAIVLTGTAIGLAITPIGVLYSDVGKGLPLLMQVFMYITPVVFPIPTNGWALTLFQLNPLTVLIVTARSLLTGSSIEQWGLFLIINVIVTIVLCFAWVIYRAAMPILIERMSA